MQWSDMYQEVRFNRRTEAGGGELTWATRSAPHPPQVITEF